MYLKVSNQKNKDGEIRQYVYLVKSERQGKRVVQTTVGSLGRLETLLEGDTAENIATKLAQLSKKFEILNIAKDLEAQEGKEIGRVLVFRHIWKLLQYDTLITRLMANRKTKFSIETSVFAMVCNKLMDPESKRGTAQWLQTVYEPKWEGLELQHLYRGMDALVEKKEAIEFELFERTRDLFNLDVDMVLFDTTSIMSWGEGEYAPILRHGHSKEKRPDLKQVMVGVMMTKEGIPVGHEVWEGNQSDKKSFAAILKKVKTTFKLNKVILVGDRGMISQKNIQALEEEGLQYILGLPMRKMDAHKRQILLGTDTVTPGESPTSEVNGYELVVATADKRLYVKDRTLTDEKTGNAQRYIICYNPDEAEYQAKNRAYFKSILEKKVQYSTVKSWIVKNGYRKYLTIESKDGSEVIVKMDEDKLKNESIYDGKWVLTTNTPLESQDIARAYKGLSQIEQAFRELKSTIEIGPMYHWTTQRIRAHVFVCFLALAIEIACQKTLKTLGLSFSQAIDEMKSVDVSKTTIGKKSFWLTSEPSELAKKIFAAFNCKIPKKCL